MMLNVVIIFLYIKRNSFQISVLCNLPLTSYFLSEGDIKKIIQQVVVKWNRKSNKKRTKNKTPGDMQLEDVDNFAKSRASSEKDIHKRNPELECLV